MSLDEAALLDDVKSRLFAPSPDTRTIGAELELIPRFADSGAPVLAGGSSGVNLVAIVRAVAASLHWQEVATDAGPPSWNFTDGGRLTFEPGGQIEISSPPLRSCSGLIGFLQEIVAALSKEARVYGIDLLSLGADPFNDILAVPLQLRSDRYVRMTRYLEARGDFGIRMMRQTAAIQISVEHGPRPLERWALLNALAPYLVAIFANSSRYAGAETGHASYRAHLWRELDSSRTGIPFDAGDAPGRYARFAFDAGAIGAENGAGEFHTFRSLIADADLDKRDWELHLSTLFPEIRPKEYFEIRSPDAVAVADVAAPLAFVCGIVYDSDASRDALTLLGSPDVSLLRIAGLEGLGNAAIRSRASELIGIAMRGVERLPGHYLSPAHRRHAADWLAKKVG